RPGERPGAGPIGERQPPGPGRPGEGPGRRPEGPGRPGEGPGRPGDGPPRFQDGSMLPPFAREELKLTGEQQKQLEALEKEPKEKLLRILTPEQVKMLDTIQPPRGGPGGPGGPREGPGRRPDGGERPGRPGEDRPPPRPERPQDR